MRAREGCDLFAPRTCVVFYSSHYCERVCIIYMRHRSKSKTNTPEIILFFLIDGALVRGASHLLDKFLGEIYDTYFIIIIEITDLTCVKKLNHFTFVH